MKKIMLAFAVMAMVFASCSKSEFESVQAKGSDDMVLNIGEVSGLGTDGSKALVKTGWAKDDRIKIWFNSNTAADPDLVIKFDGKSWDKEGEPNLPSEAGYLKAVYGNGVVVASKDNYTVKDKTLTININSWKFLSEIQVVVTGFADKYGSYTLKCGEFYPLDQEGYNVKADTITARTKGPGKSTAGMSNQDGIAFVFATANYSNSEDDITKKFVFTLRDNIEEEEYTYTVTDKAITAIEGKKQIKALKIDGNKFMSKDE